MEEDLAKFCIADNADFGLIPGKLLSEEVRFRRGFLIDCTHSLYRLCENLALHYYDKPFGITSKVSFDYLQTKVSNNLMYKEAYGGFEPTVFQEVGKIDFVIVDEKPIDSELEIFLKKGSRGKKSKKSKRKFNAKNVLLPDSTFNEDGSPGRPLSKEEIKLLIERAKIVFEEANYLSCQDLGMYDVYYGYSNVELKTNEGYNFFKDGYEFNDFKLCFAFKLRQIERDNIRSFFNYQLKTNFESNKALFNDFVKDIIDGYNEPNFFPTYIIKPVNDFLGEAYLSEIKTIEITTQESEVPNQQKDTAIRTKAAKYLLLALNSPAKNDDKIEFIRYLLGKGESKNLKGSNEGKAFYDNEKKTKEGKIKDLEKIVELFKTLNLTEPLRLAQMDLNRLK